MLPDAFSDWFQLKGSLLDAHCWPAHGRLKAVAMQQAGAAAAAAMQAACVPTIESATVHLTPSLQRPNRQQLAALQERLVKHRSCCSCRAGLS
jgi:hypothetical protein